MKKLVMLIAVALSAALTMAQEKPDRPDGPGRRGRPNPPAAFHTGPWVARMLSEKAALEKIGVADAELQQKVIDALLPLKEKGGALEKQIRGISREQAQQMRALLDGKDADPKAVLDKVEEVAKLRAEQGRLSVQAILVLRDNLSREQLAAARAFIFAQGRERGQMRRGGNGGAPGGGRRGQPPDGRRPRRPPAPQE